MRSLWKGTLTVGKVSIPVSLYTAGEHDHPGFRTLHKDCGTPLGSQRVCPACDVILEPGYSESIRGFEVAEGQFVTLENAELESALGGKSIHLDRFVRADDVSPANVSTGYWLSPAKDEFARRAYQTLRHALGREELVGLGRFVYYTKEHVALVWPHEDGLLGLHTLYVGNELRDVSEISRKAGGVEVDDAEVELMAQALQQRTRTIGPVLAGRSYKRRILEVVHAKARSGETITVATAPTVATVDLADALQRSIRKSSGRAVKPT